MSHCRYLIDTIIDLIWHNQVSGLGVSFWKNIVFALVPIRPGSFEASWPRQPGLQRQQAAGGSCGSTSSGRWAASSGRPAGERGALSTWRPLMLMEAAKRYWGCGIFGVITLFFNIGNTAIGVYLTVVERGSFVLVFESIAGLNSSEHKLCENLKFPVFPQCWPRESIKSYKESNNWSSALFLNDTNLLCSSFDTSRLEWNYVANKSMKFGKWDNSVKHYLRLWR